MTTEKILPDIRKVQKRVAYGSIGPSTLRNQGAPGVSKAAQRFLINIDLDEFKGAESEERYLEILNKFTDELKKQFPEGAKDNWGAARKALNVFMEEAFYNKFLNEEYNLDRLSIFLEVPIDSYVVKNLKKEATMKPPKWEAIKKLTPSDNMKWQEIASEVAGRKGILKVYLDLEYWRS